MVESYDVIVIGAGVHGASTAFHLAERGAKTLVLERAAAASGATGRSSGLVRMHYDLKAESALAWASYKYFTDWEARVGGDSGFTRTGFVRIVPASQEANLRANVADMVDLGIPTTVIPASDVKKLAPMLTADDFDFAAYEPDSGYADPTSTCNSLLAAARRLGATYRPSTPVEAIETEGGRVVGVKTANGSIGAPVVVLAAGGWSGPLGRSAGVDIDLKVWHHDTGFVRQPTGSGDGLPVVIDDINELYFRPEGQGLALIGLEDGNRIDDKPGDDSRSDPKFVEHMVDRLTRRVPDYANAGFQGAHGGTDGITPDQRMVVGRHGPDGLIWQTGMSGTGFKIAPAVGLAVSELVLDGATHSVDISLFDPGRFERGQPLRGDHPYGDLWR